MDDKYLKKKEKIKEVASYLFETLGFMNATMEMIAGKVGMKKTHFTIISRIKMIYYRK